MEGDQKTSWRYFDGVLLADLGTQMGQFIIRVMEMKEPVVEEGSQHHPNYPLPPVVVHFVPSHSIFLNI